MGVYNNNKDGTRSTLANTIQVVDAPMEQFVSRGEFSAVTPNDVSADNKLVAENEVTKAVDTMPTASSSLVGTIVQYVGTTTANYTNGYFYKCVSDGALDPTYSWEEVISGGGGADLPWVTPQDYGAVGDGVTDDSVAVAQALASNNEIYFPEGTYALSKQLVLNDNQKVFGAGSGKTILLFTSDDLAEGQTYNRGRVVTGVSNYLESQTLAHDITLSGMTLTSNYNGQSTAGKTLLLLTNCKDVYVEDVACIITSDDTHDANAMEVLENGHDITFVNCYFEQGQEVGEGCVEIRNTYSENCSNIKFFNCDFYKTGGVDEIFAVFTVAYQGAHSLIDGVLCDGCRFESNPSANASSHAYDIEVTWGDTKNIVFTNCEFISKDTSVATIKRLNHDSTNMEQVVFDHCTIKATRDSSASTRSPIFYVENITSEDGIIQYLNGSVYGEGKTSLMSNYRAADVVNCDIDCYIDGATCIDSTIYTGSRTRMGNGLARFIGCDIRHDSTVTSNFLIQASIVKDCLYRSGRALTVQFTGANRNCIVEGNTFEPNVSISDYSTSNIAIDIVANNFKGDMFISSIVSSVIRRYALIDNLVGGNVTVGGSSKVTVRRGNSFDGRETPDEQVQKSTMPTASEARLGKVYQYVGETTSSFTNGYFYKCVSDGESTPTYSWEQTDVQPEGGSGSGDMLASVYDPNGTVAEAGGIVEYVGSIGGGIPHYATMPTDAQLLAMANKTVFETDGYWAQTDGHGGKYIITTNAWLVGGMLRITDGTTTKYLAALDNDGNALTTCVDPTRYGVRAIAGLNGNLTLENTYATQNSDIMSRITNTHMNATIKFPKGYYVFESPLNFTNRQYNVAGAGLPVTKTTTLSLADYEIGTVLCFPFLTNGQTAISTAGNSTIENLAVYGNKNTYNFVIDRTKLTTAPNEVIAETIAENEGTQIQCKAINKSGGGQINNVFIFNFYTGITCQGNTFIKNFYARHVHYGINCANDTKMEGIGGFNVHTLIRITGSLCSVLHERVDSCVHALEIANGSNHTITDVDGDWCTDSLIAIGNGTTGGTISSVIFDGVHGRCNTLKAYDTTQQTTPLDVRTLPSIDGYGIIRVYADANFRDSRIVVNSHGGSNPMDGTSTYLTPDILFTFSSPSNKTLDNITFVLAKGIYDIGDILRVIQTRSGFSARVDDSSGTYFIEGAVVTKGNALIVTTMPTASASEEGNIYLYMGASDATQWISQGATYKCVSDGNGGYEWRMVSINLETLAAILQNSTTFDDFKAMILGE